MQTKKLLFMAALALTFAACSEEIEQVQQPARTGGIPFSATISIEKSTTNRALTEDAVNNKIEASWADGEQVALIYDAGGTPTKTDATVTKQTDGTATITATLEEGATNGSDVTIIYPASAADGTTGNVKAGALAAQDGTLTGTGGTSIAENYDVRTGSGKLSIGAGGATVNNGTAGTPVSLTNQVAIFKFTTKNASSTAISVNSLTVTIGTQHYVVTPASETNELYVALPAVTSSQTVIFSAVGSDSKNYFLAKDNRTFAAGKYYQSPLTMTQGVHLAALTANYTAQDGDVLTGTLDGETQPYKISIAAPVAPATTTSITLDNAVINGWSDGASLATESAVNWAGLTPLGNATIILKDGTTNSVKGFYNNNPGILAAVSSTLVIKGGTAGTGTLTANSNGYGAGIGGGLFVDCGNIWIQGGIITANCNNWSAGIGGGDQQSCGNITISGGTVTATGGTWAAGIGSGSAGSCGTITITSDVTSVTATKGDSAPNSIGAGDGGTCGTVTIGGVVGAITTSPYTYAPIPGLLSGNFSVSNTKQVQYSQGNLQYQASTNTWRFAEHQYDYVGDASNGNVYVESTKSNNASISQTYTGWIDLFGWGTSGKTIANYGTLNQPWATSSTNNQYGPTNGTSGLTGDYADGDWGVNMGTGWRTLTSDEWTYLFNTRTTSTVAGTANARFAKAYLFGTTHGIILFPDSYTHPDGVTAPTGINATGNTSWNANQYNATDWGKMEAAGAVFLPAAGFRQGTSVDNVGSYGYYWSSTHYSATDANYLRFRSGNINPAHNINRCNGLSVRLVQDVAAP